MVGKTQVIVGAKVEYFTAFDLYTHLLLGEENALVLI